MRSLLPDITSLLMDPDIGGGQPFVIVRRTAARHKGRNMQADEQKIPASGTVQPATDDALQQLPEADRDNKVMIFRTTTPIQKGESSSTGDTYADEIEYLGDVYKVLRDKDWSPWGMYVAYATKIHRKAGETNEADS